MRIPTRLSSSNTYDVKTPFASFNGVNNPRTRVAGHLRMLVDDETLVRMRCCSEQGADAKGVERQHASKAAPFVTSAALNEAIKRAEDTCSDEIVYRIIRYAAENYLQIIFLSAIYLSAVNMWRGSNTCRCEQ